MTVIRPNSISGITSITAQANEINVFRSDGTLAGLQLNGVNFNNTSGISTLAALNVTGNISVGGTLTYQDVTNVDSVGIITARSGIDCNGTLEVSSTSNFDGAVQIADTILHLGDTNTKIRFPAADTITAETAGSERLRIDSSGNLLIGRTAWVDNHFDNGIYLAGGTQAGMKFMRTASGSAGTYDIGIDTDRAFKFVYTGDSGGTGTERLRITSDGDLLIGTTTNGGGNRLYVVDSFTDAFVNPSDSILRIENANTSGTTGQASISFTSKTTGSNADSAIVSQAEDASGNARLEFWTDTSNGMTEKMSITSDGKIGISRTATQHPLEIGHASEPTVSLWGGSTKRAALQAQSGGTYLYSYENSPLIFSVNSAQGFTERLRINSDGNLLVNTTGSSGAKIQINNHTFSGGHYAYSNDRVGFQMNGGLRAMALCSTYNDANHPEYGLVFVHGPNTSSYNVWGLCPDGPAKGNSLNLHYGPQATNIHTDNYRKFSFTGEGYALTPNQPSFLAEHQHAGGSPKQRGELLNQFIRNFTTVRHNTGNCYSNSTGKFTAPVAGMYLFHIDLTMDGGDGQDDSAGCYFRVENNSANYNRTHGGARDFHSVNPRYHTTANGYEMNSSFQTIEKLAAGATCGFYFTDWDHTSTRITTAFFSGYMLG